MDELSGTEEKWFKPVKKDKAEKIIFSKGKKEKVIYDSLGKKEKAGKMAIEEYEAKMKSKKSKQKKDQAKTRAARAGLEFPVARIHSKLKAMVPANARVGGTAAVFMAAVIEYLVAELCELAGERAKLSDTSGGPKKRVRISPRAIQFAIAEDHEFAELLKRVTLSGGGVVPMTDKKLRDQMNANKKPKKPAPEEDEPMMPEDTEL